MELEDVIVPLVANSNRGVLVAVHQSSCVDNVTVLRNLRVIAAKTTDNQDPGYMEYREAILRHPNP